MTAEDILQRVETLIGQRPFNAAAAAATTEAELEPDGVTSNRYYTVYKGAGAPFTQVEVREPTAASAGKSGLILLSLEAPCLTREDVGQRFGAAAPPAPPRPGGPPNAPRYERFPQEWGEVRLGYRDDCLVSVVLDGS